MWQILCSLPTTLLQQRPISILNQSTKEWEATSMIICGEGNLQIPRSIQRHIKELWSALCSTIINHFSTTIFNTVKVFKPTPSKIVKHDNSSTTVWNGVSWRRLWGCSWISPAFHWTICVLNTHREDRQLYSHWTYGRKVHSSPAGVLSSLHIPSISI